MNLCKKRDKFSIKKNSKIKLKHYLTQEWCMNYTQQGLTVMG